MARSALVIGIARYSNFRNLEKTVNDAGAIAEILEQHGAYAIEPLPRKLVAGDENCYELDRDPKKEVKGSDLTAKLKTFLLEQAKGKDALIYFAGHGFVVPDVVGDEIGYLAATDAGKDGQNALSFDTFTKLVAKSELNNLVVLLDCCNAGNLIESSHYQAMQKVFNDKKNYYLMAACRGFERSREGAQHGIFTAAVLEVLRERVAAGEAVDLDSLFSEVSQRLKQSGQEVVRSAMGGAITLIEKARGNLAPVVFEDICPYVGLEAFTKETARFFKGRDRFVRLLLQKIAESSFVPVIGASGSGKSSLVRAGLISELEAQGWLILPPIKPGDFSDNPVMGISSVLAQLCQRADTKREISKQIASGNLEAAIACLTEPKKILLVVDQFEEVFTVCPVEKEAERQQFIDLLVGITQHPDSRLRVVTTMRADFFENCLGYRGLGEIIQLHQVLLLPMNEEELREAISAPAEAGQYELGEGLLPAILRDVRDEKNVLPLLEFALTQLWENRENRRLTFAVYDKLGGVMGALNKHADSIYDSLQPQEQEWVKRICLMLVRTGLGERDTRQRQTKRELAQLVNDGALQDFQVALDQLVAGRLLVAGKDGDGDAWVDMAHEALMNSWQRFRDWRSEDRDLRRLCDRVEDGCKEWETKGKTDDYFLPKGLITEVQQRWQRMEILLSKSAQVYYEQCKKSEKYTVAIENKLREDAIKILNLLPARPISGAIQAIKCIGINLESFPSEVLPPVQGLLHSAVEMSKEVQRCLGHDKGIKTVAFSPDSKWIVSGSDDKTIRLWDLQGKHLKSFIGHEDGVRTVAISPDGRWIISGSSDKTLRLWNLEDIEDTNCRRIFEGHTNWVMSVAFSPDSRWVISGGSDNKLCLWDLEDNHCRKFVGHKNMVRTVAFSRDGKWIASGSDDKTILLWDLDGNQIGKPFIGHEDGVRSVAFSRDGKWIASGSSDKTIRLWNLQNETHEQHGQPFRGHENWVRSVAFSPNSKMIVSGGDGKTVRLWDLQGNKVGYPFRGHENWVRAVAFSPDGKYIVSGSDDKTIRLWEWQGNQIETLFQGHENWISSVAFSPDGKYIVSSSSDKTIRLWDIEGNQIKIFQGHKDMVRSVAFSPDGKKIVSGSDDQILLLWDLEGNKIAKPFVGHENWVRSVAFSHDGKRIISGSSDKTLRLWDLEGNQIGQPFQGHEDWVNSVAFSPTDGKWIVSGSDDNTIRLWDLEGNQIGQPFQRHEHWVRAVAFSPDGNLIISGSDDKTLILWRGGTSRDWMKLICNRLRDHPIFKNPPDDLSREACEVCYKHVWEKDK
jgi:WD40 repeat protein/energy-coupling factor transporter ATP-binding protein EcfA2